MPDVSFSSLAVVMAVAFGSRLVLGLLPQARLPGVVVEIVLGIVVGPSVLGSAEPDEVVRILAVVGLAFLLFLGGLELDLRRLRGRSPGWLAPASGCRWCSPAGRAWRWRRWAWSTTHCWRRSC
jgi:NhaP-type Na+/H+ or K+/H+ antiporter